MIVELKSKVRVGSLIIKNDFRYLATNRVVILEVREITKRWTKLVLYNKDGVQRRLRTKDITKKYYTHIGIVSDNWFNRLWYKGRIIDRDMRYKNYPL